MRKEMATKSQPKQTVEHCSAKLVGINVLGKLDRSRTNEEEYRDGFEMVDRIPVLA